MPRSSDPLRGLLLIALAGAGCAPTCQALCDKLDRCALDPSVGDVECRTACERELEALREEDDDEGLDAFNEHRRCLGSSSCDEIAEGVCFDAAVFPFDGA